LDNDIRSYIREDGVTVPHDRDKKITIYKVKKKLKISTLPMGDYFI